MRKIIVAGLALIIGITTIRASLAQWTFETSKPTSNGPYAAENGVFAGTSTASAFHDGAGSPTYSNPAGAGSAESFSANHWSENDYFQFATSTLGYEDIEVNFEAVSSSTGPQDFDLACSTDGTSFSVFTSYSLLANGSPSWSSSLSSSGVAKYAFQFDLSAKAELNNQATIYLRLIDAGTNSVSGGIVSSSGTSRVDDFTICGSAIPSGDKSGAVPEPSTWFAGALMLLPFFWPGIRLCRKR